MLFSTLAAAALLAASVVAQSSTATPWPTESFKTQPTFTPPVLKITKTSEAIAPGYLFFAPDGRPPIQVAPLIVDTNGALVWNGPSEHAFNFGVQLYKGNPVLTYWSKFLIWEYISPADCVIQTGLYSQSPLGGVTVRYICSTIPTAPSPRSL